MGKGSRSKGPNSEISTLAQERERNQDLLFPIVLVDLPVPVLERESNTRVSRDSSLGGCLHVPTLSGCLSLSPSKFIIVLMVTVRLKDRMGVEPILPVRRAVIISTMINFDSDSDGHGDGIGTCKHAFRTRLHQVPELTQNQCCDDACDITLTEKNGVTQNGLQSNSGLTLFVSISFNKSYVASFIVALTLF